jgi:SEC-C motif
MGALADAIVAYAQPLIDQTDGSLEQMNNALAMSQLCYNLALVPAEKRDAMISEMRPDLQMDDEEFDAFRRSVIIPMIRRHEEMFPRLHGRLSIDLAESGPSLEPQPRTAASREAFPGTDRYAPCPCNSGQKYKFCCGMKRR